jgi:hypothetical protein
MLPLPEISPIWAPFAFPYWKRSGSTGSDVYTYGKVPYNQLFCKNTAYNRSKNMPFIALAAGLQSGR